MVQQTYYQSRGRGHVNGRGKNKGVRETYLSVDLSEVGLKKIRMLIPVSKSRMLNFKIKCTFAVTVPPTLTVLLQQQKNASASCENVTRHGT